ncbi:MAG: DUF1592 domain-containing protein [Bryobacteraceae bacterium]|nr:DUF1592 domain-containing protein [Bryobacteraceae bacterium]
MNLRKQRPRPRNILALTLAVLAGAAQFRATQAADTPNSLEPGFELSVKPLLQKNCAGCHNGDNPTAGVKVDQLDARLDDRHIRLWEGIRHRLNDGTMPPKGLPQPTPAQRQEAVAWITRGLEIARLRPAPKNGLVRRLTVAQYRNTLRELLSLEDDLTEIVPPDAVSADGFLNNKDTLQLSPLLLEAYFEIAEEALKRAIVDPGTKPKIQNFRVDLGSSINPKPLPEQLILGANSLLLDNKDFTVTQLTPAKPFPSEPDFMRTKYRFIEGYAGNDTVRGWREYDSIYHSVFACMRGSSGYPKGRAYSSVPGGLLLRPAIPNDEMFDEDGTYGPKANFKISLRELPDAGRFRVTVTASKYNDGLLLDKDAPAMNTSGSLLSRDFQRLVVPAAGLYQVDVYAAPRNLQNVPPDASRLGEGANWPLDGPSPGRLEGNARLVDSPFRKALSLDGKGDALVIPRSAAMNVGTGDFTVSAWLHPQQLRRAGVVALGGHGQTQGWYLETVNDRGALRLETAGPNGQPNGALISPPGTIRAGVWQHVSAVVRRGAKEARLYVNGYAVAKGEIGAANLDNPQISLHIGRIPDAQYFQGEIDEVRLDRRALAEAEIQALVQPGRQFVVPPPAEKPQELKLSLGEREFSGNLTQPAFLAVRLAAGPMKISARYAGVSGLERLVLTPISPTHELAQRLQAFEKRSPKLGVHVGLRRDCGSTFAPVGAPQTVAKTQLSRFIFEGAIRNFPSPDVEKDNVNYLAGIREIAVRSEYTDGRDMPRLQVRSVEFEGPYYDTWPPASHRAIFLESPRKHDPRAYGKEIISAFATRAYRRPLKADEFAALLAIFEKSLAAGRTFEDSVKDTLQVVLTSPQFLFLTETSTTAKPEPLDGYELASKLSYFFWNGPPDRTTLSLAAAGTLRPQLDAEVERMIAHPRFSQFTREFVAQWLSLDKFSVLEPDRKRFPKLTRDTRAQLRQEPIQYFEYLVRQNLPARNLVTSDVVLANEVVASYYDLGDRTESGFQFVPIPHRRPELGGVLTQAALMAGLSDGRESNPVKRGAWLARKIIAEPPADPPPNVPALKEDTQNLTLRQRLEQHRNQPGCQQCHAKIDPWGVALEEFDAGGRRKTQPVDAHSKLPDQTEVNGANDLKRYLAGDRMDQVAFSLLKHLTTYATGRSLSYSELIHLKQDSQKLKANGYRMKDLLRYVVHSQSFLEK